MLVPCQIRVIAGTIDYNKMFAIYKVSDADGTVQYVGVSRLPELLLLKDARNNTQWVNVFGNPFAVIDISVESLTLNEQEARMEQRRLIKLHVPHCNIRGYHQAQKYQSVICNETDEVFRNAAEAAKMHGINASNLAKHLKHEPGHKTIKGRTYSYIVR